ncbi:hypothetical protein EBT16_12250 [bacterium]|nr:hypothetical protein [bacterium]
MNAIDKGIIHHPTSPYIQKKYSFYLSPEYNLVKNNGGVSEPCLEKIDQLSHKNVGNLPPYAKAASTST